MNITESKKKNTVKTAKTAKIPKAAKHTKAKKQLPKKAKNKKVAKVTKGGTTLSNQLGDIMDYSNLDLNKDYPGFDYNKYANNIRLSYFASAGKNKKKTVKGLKGLKGGTPDDIDNNYLTVPLKSIYNVSSLDYGKGYDFIPVKYISQIPHSQFGSLTY